MISQFLRIDFGSSKSSTSQPASSSSTTQIIPPLPVEPPKVATTETKATPLQSQKEAASLAQETRASVGSTKGSFQEEMYTNLNKIEEELKRINEMTRACEKLIEEMSHSGIMLVDREKESLLQFVLTTNITEMQGGLGYILGLRDGMEMGLAHLKSDMQKAIEKLQTETRNIKEQNLMAQKQTTDLMNISGILRSMARDPAYIAPEMPPSVKVPIGAPQTTEASPNSSAQDAARKIADTAARLEAERQAALLKHRAPTPSSQTSDKSELLKLEVVLKKLRMAPKDLRRIGDIKLVEEIFPKVCHDTDSEEWEAAMNDPRLLPKLRINIYALVKSMVDKIEEKKPVGQ